METVFISKLKPLLDAVAKEMELYVHVKSGEYYFYKKYDASKEAELNSIRACTPVKEFLVPARQLAATFPHPAEPQKEKPFAVFGLKDCDIRSIQILDRIFADEEFADTLYIAKREKMFLISSDCSEPAATCFCNLFESEGYPKSGFDLNVSAIKDGFIIEAGSKKGNNFLKMHQDVFAEVPKTVLAERDKNREQAKKKLAQINASYKFDGNIRAIVEDGFDSSIIDEEAKNCIECQACTRVCPTCHCFYLYDTTRKDYFAKMKMWDSCVRCAYAAVAGGANPRKIVGDRIKHRLMHKFVYFLDRYGVNMCVGCGRCIDADAGGIDLREILKKFNEEYKKEKTKAAK